MEYGAQLVLEAGWNHVPQPLHRPGFPRLMDNPRLFSVYPALAAGLFQTLYTIDGATPPPLWQGCGARCGRTHRWAG